MRITSIDIDDYGMFTINFNTGASIQTKTLRDTFGWAIEAEDLEHYAHEMKQVEQEQAGGDTLNDLLYHETNESRGW